MFKKILSFLLLVGLVEFGYSNVVSSITKCTAADSKCIKRSTQALIPIFAKGIPELGVEKLDPVTLDKIDASTSGLKLIITDLTVTGLENCVIKKIQRDLVKSKITAKLMCTVDANGYYEMTGKLLVVPVQGQGKLHVALRKVLLNIDADMSEKVKNGKSYWDVKRFSHSYELQDKADVVFENLFAGNEVLGRAASQVIATSGNEIVLEVGPPVVEALTTRVVGNIKKFFNNVAPEDLSID